MLESPAHAGLEQSMSERGVSVSTAENAAEGGVRGYGWPRTALLVAALVALLLAIYGPVVLPVWFEDLWSDPNYSHVFIVPIISGFVLWRRWRGLAALPIEGSWLGV